MWHTEKQSRVQMKANPQSDERPNVSKEAVEHGGGTTVTLVVCRDCDNMYLYKNLHSCKPVLLQ